MKLQAFDKILLDIIKDMAQLKVINQCYGNKISKFRLTKSVLEICNIM